MNQELNTKKKKNIRTVEGIVESVKMDKTISVRIGITQKHAIFKKIIKLSKKVYAHDEKKECALGDRVELIETRPLSKMKRYKLIRIIERAK